MADITIFMIYLGVYVFVWSQDGWRSGHWETKDNIVIWEWENCEQLHKISCLSLWVYWFETSVHAIFIGYRKCVVCVAVLFVFVDVTVCVCVYACLYLCLCLHAFEDLWICICATCTCAHVFACTRVCSCAFCAHVFACARVCSCAFCMCIVHVRGVHVCMHASVYACMRVCVCVCVCVCVVYAYCRWVVIY